MQIAAPEINAPFCQCGVKADVILYPHALKVKCPFCGKKASIRYTDGFYHFDVRDLACLAAIISNDTDE